MDQLTQLAFSAPCNEWLDSEFVKCSKSPGVMSLDGLVFLYHSCHWAPVIEPRRFSCNTHSFGTCQMQCQILKSICSMTCFTKKQCTQFWHRCQMSNLKIDVSWNKVNCPYLCTHRHRDAQGKFPPFILVLHATKTAQMQLNNMFCNHNWSVGLIKLKPHLLWLAWLGKGDSQSTDTSTEGCV